MEVVHEQELGEPFTAARFANRNVALLQEDGGITIYVQNYKTSKFAGSDTVPIQVSFEKDRKGTQTSKCYGCLFTDNIFHRLKGLTNIHVVERKSTVVSILKQKCIYIYIYI